MDKLNIQPGGREFVNDDLQTLQDQNILTHSLLRTCGPCIVSGCTLYTTNGSTWNIASGVVWNGGELLTFAGQNTVTFPAMFTTSPEIVVDQRSYATAGTFPGIVRRVALLVPFDAANPELKLDSEGAITIWDRIQEKTRQVGTVEYVTDTTGYDATGKGLGKKRGWHLCNGQNGTIDLRGRFVLGHNPTSPTLTLNQLGQRGGDEAVGLTALQNGPHAHGTGTYNRLVRVAPVGGGALTATAGNAQGAGGTETDIFTSQEMATSGRGELHNNMPPYYVLVARQWTGL